MKCGTILRSGEKWQMICLIVGSLRALGSCNGTSTLSLVVSSEKTWLLISVRLERNGVLARYY